MANLLLWVTIAGLLIYGLAAISRPRSISTEEYEQVKGRSPMLQPLLELQNIYNPGMKDLLKAKTEIRQEREGEGDPPEPGVEPKGH